MDSIPRYRFLLTAALCAGTVAAAVAQPPGRGRGGPGGGRGGPGGGMGGLLQSDQVRTELDINESQMEDLESLQEEMRDRMREQFMKMRDGGGFDRDAMREQFTKMRDEAQERLGSVLSTSQMDRLKQINYQQQLNQGTSRALTSGPLAEELGLTEDQIEQMREKAREVQAKLEEKMQAARDEAREELLTVLTSEQRAKLETLTGTPFTMARRGGQDGRFGGGSPQGGPRGFGQRGRGDRGGSPRGQRRGGRPGTPPPPGGEPEL